MDKATTQEPTLFLLDQILKSMSDRPHARPLRGSQEKSVFKAGMRRSLSSEIVRAEVPSVNCAVPDVLTLAKPTKHSVFSQRDGDWKCVVCSRQNFTEFDTCVVCGRAKQTNPGVAIAADRSSNSPNTSAVISEDKCSAYSHSEKVKNKANERIQSDYRSFVQSKLRLDNHALVRREFADEIQSVLSAVQGSGALGDLVAKRDQVTGASDAAIIPSRGRAMR